MLMNVHLSIAASDVGGTVSIKLLYNASLVVQVINQTASLAKKASFKLVIVYLLGNGSIEKVDGFNLNPENVNHSPLV